MNNASTYEVYNVKKKKHGRGKEKSDWLKKKIRFSSERLRDTEMLQGQGIRTRFWIERKSWCVGYFVYLGHFLYT